MEKRMSCFVSSFQKINCDLSSFFCLPVCSEVLPCPLRLPVCQSRTVHVRWCMCTHEEFQASLLTDPMCFSCQPASAYSVNMRLRVRDDTLHVSWQKENQCHPAHEPWKTKVATAQHTTHTRQVTAHWFRQKTIGDGKD